MGPSSPQHAGKEQDKKEAGTLCQFLPVVFIGPRATSPPMALPSGAQSLWQGNWDSNLMRGGAVGVSQSWIHLGPAVQGGTQRKVGQ